MTSLTDRYRALLRVLKAVVAIQDFPSLVQSLRPILHAAFQFEVFDLYLVDPSTLKVTPIFSGRTPKCAECMRLDDNPGEQVYHSQIPIVISIEEVKVKFPRMAKYCLESFPEASSMCLVPLTTARHRLGYIMAISSHENAYGKGEVEFICHLANSLAVAVENALSYDKLVASESSLALERDHLRMLMKVTNATVSKLDLRDFLIEILSYLHSVVAAECIGLYLYDKAKGSLSPEAFYFDERTEAEALTRDAAQQFFPSQASFTDPQPSLLREAELKHAAESIPFIAAILSAGFCYACMIPLYVREEYLGLVITASHNNATFETGMMEWLSEIAKQVSIGVDNILAYREVTRLKDQIASEKLYLQEEIRSDHNFEEIIGESAALKRMLAQVEKVADTDSSVLIIGETGTGKELIARAIHNLSHRRERPLVKLNCAAIPGSLLESELFGHERGAFTGAITQKTGRLELADHGTLFLDEIGELSLELQPKMLRALQEREFERVGGTHPVKVDFRLIAATNRSLEEMVLARQFRSDLFYRLNVFPIAVPPLRERREDIPQLVRYFTQKYTRRTNRKVNCIPTETMTRLTNMNWPGNVRELENVIERAVILSTGSALEVPDLSPEPASSTVLPPVSFASQHFLEEDSDFAERENIFRALLNSNGIVSGPCGAAQKLGISAAALFAKMLVLGISYRETQLGQVRPSPLEHVEDEKAVERARVLRVLNEANWVIGGEKGAAARLGTKRTTLLARLSRLGITRHKVAR